MYSLDPSQVVDVLDRSSVQSPVIPRARRADASGIRAWHVLFGCTIVLFILVMLSVFIVFSGPGYSNFGGFP
jgi:hypothetical protein